MNRPRTPMLALVASSIGLMLTLTGCGSLAPQPTEPTPTPPAASPSTPRPTVTAPATPTPTAEPTTPPLGQVTATSPDGYVATYTFKSVTATATTDVQYAPPGKTNMDVSVSVSATLQNQTPGRQLIPVLPTASYLAFPVGSATCSTSPATMPSKSYPTEPFGNYCLLPIGAIQPSTQVGPDETVPLFAMGTDGTNDFAPSAALETFQVDEVIAQQVSDELANAIFVAAFPGGNVDGFTFDVPTCELTLRQPGDRGNLLAQVFLTGATGICD